MSSEGVGGCSEDKSVSSFVGGAVNSAVYDYLAQPLATRSSQVCINELTSCEVSECSESFS